jgi:4-hydroxy-2-oxoheptanedioate aldolase
MRLRELFERGQPMLGGWASMASAFGAEVLGQCGFDWVCIDTQHGIIGYDQMVPMLQGLSVKGTPALVRVSWNTPGEIMKALDAGAEGVIIPMVNSPEEAMKAVGACRYPPEGFRSWGPTRAALGRPDFGPATGNREAICVIMVETVEALDRLDEIVATPGVDAVFVGPNDLAISNGLEPSWLAEIPQHHQQIERILETCLRHGVVAGIACGSEEMAVHWRDLGFRMLALMTDAILLRTAAQQILSALRKDGPVAQSKAAYA